MRLFCISDLHLMARTPGWRKDDFLQTQTRKLQFILDQIVNPDDFLLIGGDFWDTPKIPFHLFSYYSQQIFDRHGDSFAVFSVFGQHDLRYHTRKENTPLNALSVTKTVNIIGSDPFPLEGKVHLYGASWMEEAPKIEKPNYINLLLMHKTITRSGPLFPGQEGYVEAKDFLKQHPFDIVISGDNHKTFCYQDKSGRVLINPGSVCRTAIDQIDHKPKMFVIELNPCGGEKKIRQIDIPIEPAIDVFDLEKAVQKGEIEEATKKQVEDFLKALKQQPEQSGLNFERNLRERAEGLPKGIKNILLECIREKEEVE